MERTSGETIALDCDGLHPGSPDALRLSWLCGEKATAGRRKYLCLHPIEKSFWELTMPGREGEGEKQSHARRRDHPVRWYLSFVSSSALIVSAAFSMGP